MSQRLGDLLVKEKIITPEQLEQANKAQKEQNCRLGSALVKLGFLTDEDVTNFLSRQYGVPAINLSYFEIDPAVVKLIPFETAKRYQILPLSRVGASLTIAMVDPTNVFAMDDIKFMTGFNIEPVVASESSILAGIDKAYGTTKEGRSRNRNAVDVGDERERRRSAGGRAADGAVRAGEGGRRSSRGQAGEPGA
jgi:type IV pilus assembly protein PilB